MQTNILGNKNTKLLPVQIKHASIIVICFIEYNTEYNKLLIDIKKKYTSKILYLNLKINEILSFNF